MIWRIATRRTIGRIVTWRIMNAMLTMNVFR
jgi:hypothetical protein